jgi:hypothetical protein
LRRNPRQRQNPGADPDTHRFLQWITIAHAFLAILLLLGDSHASPAEPSGSLTRALVPLVAQIGDHALFPPIEFPKNRALAL